MRSLVPLLVAGAILLAEAGMFMLSDVVAARARGPVLTTGLVIAAALVIWWMAKSVE